MPARPRKRPARERIGGSAMIPAINEVGIRRITDHRRLASVMTATAENAKIAQERKRVNLQRRARRMRGGTPQRKDDARKKRLGRPMAAAKGNRTTSALNVVVTNMRPVMPNASTAQTQQKMMIGPSSVGLRHRVEKTRPSGNRLLQNASQNSGRYRL